MAGVLDSGMWVSTNLTRIYVQFTDVFWDNTVLDYFVVPDPVAEVGTGSSPGDLAYFRNLNHKSIIPGSNTLCFLLVTPDSDKYEAMTDSGVRQAVMRRLRTIFHDKTVPDPVALYISRWGRDPLYRGVYSMYSMPSGTSHDETVELWNTAFELWQAPVEHNGEARVYLGGEAMCPNLAGSTHGGYQSGLQFAGRCVNQLHVVYMSKSSLCIYPLHTPTHTHTRTHTHIRTFTARAD